MTDKEKKIVRGLNHPLYNVKYLEEWKDREDNVFINAPAALQSMGAKGFYDAVCCIVQSQNIWIPVEVRMPDKPGDYWVAMRHLDGSVTTEKMFWSPDWPHKDAWDEVVVVWQPYYCPEPFIPQN